MIKIKNLFSAVLIIMLSGCTQIQPTSAPEPAVSQQAVVAEVAESELLESEDQEVEESGYVPTEIVPPEVAVSVSEESNPEEEELASVEEIFQEVLAREVPDLPTEEEMAMVRALCREIGNKLGSVDEADCLEQEFNVSDGYSINDRPILIKDFIPTSNDNDLRVLILGGIHGDEYSSISIMFKWMAMFQDNPDAETFHWRFAPAVNPDGLLDGRAVRQNANGVDLNRNFPSRDWNNMAGRYWEESTGRNPRRFPGDMAASEPEVQWIVKQIIDFKPDVIVSVHAPYHLLDFDGPSDAPEKIGELYLHQLGVYPGSLGNYAGLDLGIPVVTLELPSAGIMPSAEQIRIMWNDLVSWLMSEAVKPV